MTTLTVGLGGAHRHACVSLSNDERILGVCEQERVTRVRAAGFNESGLPDEALDELLHFVGRRRTDVTAFAVAENGAGPRDPRAIQIDHHLAHACAAFLPSPHHSAAVVVCDREAPFVSVWYGHEQTVEPVDLPWRTVGFASLYSELAEVFGFTGLGREQRLEALARVGGEREDDGAPFASLFSCRDDGVAVASNWKSTINDALIGADVVRRAALAAAVQSRIADLLVDFVSGAVTRTPGADAVCLGGSLFFNSRLNSRLKMALQPLPVYVPVSPGNAGLSIGAALHVSGNRRLAASPFLGPSYGQEAIKETLDNCKLTYEWVSDAGAVDIATDALAKGRLVAWFEGGMEWGARALGGRSILANPFSPFVLDNLNRFLKKRESWRGYALSGTAGAVSEHFVGPAQSAFMECDYVPRDPERFRAVLPAAQARVRVQTVDDACPSRFRALLDAFGEQVGIPVLVNTSFNGFREPIVCSPRDAIRVFYGTGLDLLVVGPFVVRK